jgi:hypothetical protein
VRLTNLMWNSPGLLGGFQRSPTGRDPGLQPAIGVQPRNHLSRGGVAASSSPRPSVRVARPHYARHIEAADFQNFANLTGGITSIVTGVGIIVGAWWAYVRFSRTPESGPNTSIALEGRWVRLAGKPHAVVQYELLNDGGRPWTGLSESSWVELTVLRPGDSASVNGEVDWDRCEHRSVHSALVTDVELNPTRVYGRAIVCPLPDDALATQIALKLSIETRGKYYWPETSCVVLPHGKEVAEG